jgi:hypothetical protein
MCDVRRHGFRHEANSSGSTLGCAAGASCDVIETLETRMAAQVTEEIRRDRSLVDDDSFQTLLDDEA